MRLFRTLLAASIGAGLLTSPALADRPRDQDRAFEATREGRSMPLPMIERRVMPHMGGADYLGPEFRGSTYRLKFMRNGRVIWVDVDAATGKTGFLIVDAASSSQAKHSHASSSPTKSSAQPESSSFTPRSCQRINTKSRPTS